MKPARVLIAMFVVSLFLAPTVFAQSPGSANQGAASSASAAEVPRLIKFSGTLLDAQDRPMAGPVGVTFALHAQQTGGAALWIETQNVTPDAHGNYTVLLGANSANGVPAELFASGEARWLEVQVERQAEQPRILLVSVPYALKAKDADTLGGRPASAFLTTETLAGTGNSSGTAAAASTALPSSKVQSTPKKAASVPQPAVACTSVTSDGTATANSVAKFTTACTIQSSAITETGGKVGIGTAAPAVALDVLGNNAGLRLSGTGTHQVTVTGASSGRLGQDATGFFFASDTNGKIIKFLTNNGTLNEWMRITSAGNVGIGTTNPLGKLHVAGVTPNIILGDSVNSVTSGVLGGTVSGGGQSGGANRVTDNFGTVGGGFNNQAGDNAGTTSDQPFATIGGGKSNAATGEGSTVAGGETNGASGFSATVTGGFLNTASGDGAVVAGGNSNIAGGLYAVVAGGNSNVASGTRSIVAGGAINTASGFLSFAAGCGANAAHFGAFVWSDSNCTSTASTASNQFLINASGGVGIGTNAPQSRVHILGGQWDLSSTEGDFKIGDPTYRLKMGVATGGGGAGDARIYASGGTNRLIFGTGTTDVVSVFGNQVGIGTIAPTQTLDVAGKIASQNVRARVSANDLVSTTSTSFVQVPNMTITATTGGLPVLVLANIGGALVSSNNGNDACGSFQIVLDGSTVLTQSFVFGLATFPVTLEAITTPSAGSHTYTVNWQTCPVSGGTVYASYTFGVQPPSDRTLLVLEL